MSARISTNIPSTSGNPVVVVSENNPSQGKFDNTSKSMLASRKRQAEEKNLERNVSKGENSFASPAPSATPALPYMRFRLREKMAFWKTFTKSTMVLSWIANGFDLRWINGLPPSSARFDNHKSAFQHSDFVTSNILELLIAGSIEQVFDIPYIVSPLGVVEQKEKCRLIFDGRYINQHVIIPSFKYEDLGYVHQYMQPNDYIVTTDLSKGYHHLDIAHEFWTYLGFEWAGKYYVYTCLPFGLAPACWAFTKLTRELINSWRRTGHRCSGYIDDGTHAHQVAYTLRNFIHKRVLPDMLKCGFVLNEKKSQLEPTQRAAYLGALIDTVKGCFEIPYKKRNAVISLIQRCLDESRRCSVHLLEILAGNLASMHWAFGKLSRLMTMSIYKDISSAAHISRCPT
jgi:hypothetical protein